MAKSRAPMMSVQSNGTLAQALTARRAKRDGVISFHAFPGSRTRTAPSALQVAARAKFSEAKDGWNALSVYRKSVYTARALPMRITGYNLFIREFEPDNMQVKRILLSNDDIVNLPTTFIELLPADPTLIYILHACLARCGRAAASYTYDDAAEIRLGYTAGGSEAGGLQTMTGAGRGLGFFLGGQWDGNDTDVIMYGAGALDASFFGWANVGAAAGNRKDFLEGAAISILAYNNGSPTFGGGDAGNQYELYLYYTTIDLS